jgi:hypothetical protein
MEDGQLETFTSTRDKHSHAKFETERVDLGYHRGHATMELDSCNQSEVSG